jgi:DNA-binding transcriptional MerR regulator
MTEVPANERGVYGITVAADMVGVGEQALRLYERKGLLTPTRTSGGTRRYSPDDVTTLLRVVELLADGVNLTGARHVLELEQTIRVLRLEIAALTPST